MRINEKKRNDICKHPKEIYIYIYIYIYNWWLSFRCWFLHQQRYTLVYWFFLERECVRVVYFKNRLDWTSCIFFLFKLGNSTRKEKVHDPVDFLIGSDAVFAADFCICSEAVLAVDFLIGSDAVLAADFCIYTEAVFAADFLIGSDAVLVADFCIGSDTVFVLKKIKTRS